MASYKTSTQNKVEKRNRKQAKRFSGLTYRQAQQKNGRNRDRLNKLEQRTLKEQGYRNVGWANVIALYQCLEEILRKQQFDEMSLEELFLESDRIGNKYLTVEDKEKKHRLLASEMQQAAVAIEHHFPDTQPEVISFRTTGSQKRRTVRNR